jgi:uncharacterized membrane protein YkoI
MMMTMFRYVAFPLLISLLAAPLGIERADAREPTDFERFQSLPVSLAQAVEIVERESRGRVVHIAFAVEHDRSVWDADALSDSGMFEYRVDAVSGRFVRVIEQQTRGRLFTFFNGLDLADIRRTTISIDQAVAIAERETSARAARLDIDRLGTQTEYEIFLRSADRRHRVRVDAHSGRILGRR